MKTIFKSLTLIILILLSYSKLALADITSGLIGHWSFNEGIGVTTADSSAGGHNGTLVNSPSWVSGIVGPYALNFNASNQQAVTTSLSESGLTAFSFSVWVKVPSNAYTNALSWGPNLFLGIYPADDNFIGFIPGNGFYGCANVNDGKWHHIVATFDGTNQILYVDGIFNGSLTGSFTANSSALFSIGGSAGLGYFTGFIDDVRVYNRVLSSSDVTSLFDLGVVNPSTYYVDYANGSDANNGVSTSTPWQHAPGDVNAIGNPAATGLNPGDTVIFKGGVPYIGTVNVKWSGSGVNITSGGSGYKTGDVLSVNQTGGGTGMSITASTVSDIGAITSYAEVTAGTGFLAGLPCTTTGGSGTGASFNYNSKPISYDGNSAGSFGSGKAIIDGQGDVLGINAPKLGFTGSNVSFVLINNFEIRNLNYIHEDSYWGGPTGVSFNGPGTNIELKNCYLHDIQKTALALNTTANEIQSLTAGFTIPHVGALLSTASVTNTLSASGTSSVGGTLTDTAFNFTPYVSASNCSTTSVAGFPPCGGVYKVLLGWTSDDYNTAWGYLGPLNGQSTSINIYQDINLTKPGWNFSGSSTYTTVTGATATSSNNVLTDPNANFTATGAVTDGLYFLNIQSGTGVTAGNYLITSHTATTLTVSGIIGNSTDGSIAYSVNGDGYNPVQPNTVSGTKATSQGNVIYDGAVCSVLTDPNVNFTPVMPNTGAEYFLRIISGTGVTPGDYLIRTNTATTLTAQGNFGSSTAGNIVYTIVEKYFYWIYNMNSGAFMDNAPGLGISVAGINNASIHDNIVQEVKDGISISPSVSNQPMDNAQIYNNNISMVGWGISATSGGYQGENLTNPQIYGNTLHDFWNYDAFEWGWHNDGVFLFNAGGNYLTVISGLKFYNNVYYGNVAHDTANLYIEGNITNSMIYNNVFAAQGGGYDIRLAGGPGTVSGVTIENNTLARVPGSPQSSILVQAGANVTMRNNIIDLFEGYGGDFALDAPSSVGSSSDYNLLNNAYIYTGDLEFDGIIYSLSQWQSADLSTPHDQDSIIHQNASFKSFPSYMAATSVQGLTTSAGYSRAYLISDPNYSFTFQNGDYIEYNFDGVPRTVQDTGTDSNGNYIDFSPALPSVSLQGDLVLDWKTINNFTYDLTLNAGSPGIGAGTNLSSTIGNLDANGYPRSSSGAWDIGAYAYGSKASTSGTSSVPGDVNGDGSVTLADAQLTAQVAIGGSVSNFNTANAKVDGTGKVNIYDAYFIAERAAGLITTFPSQGKLNG